MCSFGFSTESPEWRQRVFELNAQRVGAQVGQDQGSQVWTPSWDTHIAGGHAKWYRPQTQMTDYKPHLIDTGFVCLLRFWVFLVIHSPFSQIAVTTTPAPISSCISLTQADRHPAPSVPPPQTLLPQLLMVHRGSRSLSPGENSHSCFLRYLLLFASITVMPQGPRQPLCYW